MRDLAGRREVERRYPEERLPDGERIVWISAEAALSQDRSRGFERLSQTVVCETPPLPRRSDTALAFRTS
jgi:hypothetical protein